MSNEATRKETRRLSPKRVTDGGCAHAIAAHTYEAGNYDPYRYRISLETFVITYA